MNRPLLACIVISLGAYLALAIGATEAHAGTVHHSPTPTYTHSSPAPSSKPCKTTSAPPSATPSSTVSTPVPTSSAPKTTPVVSSPVPPVTDSAPPVSTSVPPTSGVPVTTTPGVVTTDAAPTPPTGLALTGSDTGLELAGGVLLLLVGVAILVFAARRAGRHGDHE